MAVLSRRSTVLFLWTLAGVVLFAACDGSQKGGSDLTLSDFQFLQLGMSYNEVITRVGEADRDIGSGVHLMVYDLQDGTEMILSFPSFDSLAAAYHYDPEKDERRTILGSDA